MTKMDASRALLLFTRSPLAEARVKGLPEAAGANLFTALLRTWADGARAVGARLVISAPPGCVARLRAMDLDAEVLFLRQEEDGLGPRLEAAARATFSAGANSIVLAGGDSPAPEASALETAFRALEEGAPGVLGPSRDGGFYLIGLGRNREDVLKPIRPGDVRAFRDCFDRISRRFGAPLVLREEADLDGPRDVARLWRGDAVPESWIPLRGLLVRISARPEVVGSGRTSRACRGFAVSVTQRGPPAPAPASPA